MPGTPYPLFSVFAFLGFVLGLVPMPWHLQAWNVGTCVYMLWASLSCLIEFVDSIMWNGTAEDLAPVWCDISTKFLIGAGVGIPAASLCINRRLYKITSGSIVSVTPREKRRAVYLDLAISIGIPVLVMALHYIVQGHRFNILEDVGCTPEIYNTPPAYPLVFMWPVLLGCISFVYASLTLRSFWRRRMQFKDLLASNNHMTVGRYFRLMLLSCTEMACTVPLGSYSIYINTAGVQLAPWISWANTHYDFSNVILVPAVIWQSERSYLISVEMGRWIYPFSAFLFFFLFGFAEEARNHYRSVFWRVLKCFGITPSQKLTTLSGCRLKGAGKSSKLASDALPPYSPPAHVRRAKRAESLSSSLAGSVIELDLEKGAPYSAPFSANSDSTTAVGCGFPAADSHITISDEYPPSLPPSPPIWPYALSPPSLDTPPAPTCDRLTSEPAVRLERGGSVMEVKVETVVVHSV